MDNSSLLLKTLLAFLLARQDLPKQPSIEGNLHKQLNGSLDSLTKKSYINENNVRNIQTNLKDFLSSHSEWLKKYEEWLEKLKAVKITPDWSPTNDEINQVCPPQTQSHGILSFSDDNSSEIDNYALVVALKSVPEVLNGNKQPEELAWLQRIRTYLLPVKKKTEGPHIGE